MYVYLVAGDEAEPAGGYDLLRAEGGVLDLAFVDGDPARLAVLTPTSSSTSSTHRHPRTKWRRISASSPGTAPALADDVCQELVGRDCPTE